MLVLGSRPGGDRSFPVVSLQATSVVDSELSRGKKNVTGVVENRQENRRKRTRVQGEIWI